MNMMKQKTNFAGLVKRVTCLICGICFCFGIYAQQQKPFVIPELKEWKGATGFFMPKQSVRIIYGAPGLQKIARQFAADYKALFGVLPIILKFMRFFLSECIWIPALFCRCAKNR